MRSKSVSKLLWLAMFLVGSAQAVPVNFQGALVEALPCTINNGQVTEVDFGNGIVIRNIDGVRYSKYVNFSVYCPMVFNSVLARISGTPTPFDADALQTDAAGLGIRLSHQDGLFPLNSYIQFHQHDPNDPPGEMLLLFELVAVPVADPGSPPSPGPFTARATLQLEYQ